MGHRLRVQAVVAFVLAGLLIAQNLPAQPTEDSSVKQDIAVFPPTALVEVSLKDRRSLRGYIVSRAQDDFTFRVKKNGLQQIAYTQVLSASQVKETHSNKKWIIIGVVGVIGVIAIGATVLKTHAGPGRVGIY